MQPTQAKSDFPVGSSPDRRRDLLITPLVRTSWHQFFPYNALSPLRHKHLFFGAYGRAPIGCIPLAIAQIFAAVASKGFPVPDAEKWSILAEVSRVLPCSSTKVREVVAELLSSIAEKTIIRADYRFSMGTPWHALRFFQKNGFPGAKLRFLRRKDSPRLISMLSEGKPVLVMGLHAPFYGHAWIVDGYLGRRIKGETTSVTGEVTDESEAIEEYLHCNYGWGGSANGFYPFGCFDTTKDPALTDPKVDLYGGKTASRHFRLFLCYIDY